MSEPIRGLILAHSSLSAGMLGAVRQIAGVENSEALRPLTNEGSGPEGIVAAVDAAAGDSPVVVFTDLSSGSCAFAARKLAMTRPQTAVICGVNLAVLLDFVFNRHLPLPELVARLVEKGREGILGSCTEGMVDVDRAHPG
jgi:mannose/fructose-specific phosphotransferase system component IIA